MLVLNLPVKNVAIAREELSRLSNPDQLRSWLKDLPVCNATTTGNMLLEAVTALNHLQLDADHRNILLDVFHPVIKDTLQTLKNKSRHPSMPLPESKLKNCQLVQDLLHELANGFKLIASEKANATQASTVKDSKLISSVYFSLFYASQSLLEYYLHYSEIPVGLWKDIHQLYSYAENKKFSENKIKEDNTQSIDHIYKRIVMLALANPYHLMHGEVTKIYTNLDAWAKLCKIIPLGSLSPSGKCVVELTDDRPAQHVRMDQGWTKLKPIDARIIDVSKLLVKLKVFIESSSSENGQKDKDVISTLALRNQRNLGMRLFEAWSIRKERKSERKQSMRNIVMAAGLSATHYFVSGEIPFTPETINRMDNADNKNTGVDCKESVFKITPDPIGFNQESNQQPGCIDDDGSLSGLSLIPMDDTSYENDAGVINMAVTGVQSMINDTRQDHDLSYPWNKLRTNAGDISNEEHTENKHLAYITNIWMQKNRSIGGLALYCDLNSVNSAMQQNESEDGAAISFTSNVKLKVHVGDIVAYKDALSMGAGWKIGSIRWIKIDSDGKMDLGIKKYSDTGTAAASKAIQGVGKGGEYFRAILISGTDDEPANNTLITSSVVYDLGTVLQLKSEEGVKEVKLTRILDTTGSFTHYEYVTV